jgi:hypothetical protein
MVREVARTANEVARMADEIRRMDDSVALIGQAFAPQREERDTEAQSVVVSGVLSHWSVKGMAAAGEATTSKSDT